mgnify:CR=1 FL=1
MAEFTLYMSAVIMIVRVIIVIFFFKYLLKIISLLEEIRDKNK